MRTSQQFSFTLPHQRALESWLRQEVAATYDAMRVEPSCAVLAKGVRESLAAAHRSSLKAR
jgi:hypothetical protein